MHSHGCRPAFRTLALAAGALIAAASAAPRASAQVAYVDSQGRQWRQMDMTVALTWNQVAAICPTDGVTPCTGMVWNQSVTGWVWATRDQVRGLLIELGAGAGGSGCNQGPSVTGDVFNLFHNTMSPENGFFVSGWSATSATLPDLKGYAYAPMVQFDIEYNSGLVCVDHPFPRNLSDPGCGIWLFRPPCKADLDLDGTVGPADLAMLLNAWGSGGAADLDGSGSVNGGDLSMLLASWGTGNC